MKRILLLCVVTLAFAYSSLETGCSQPETPCSLDRNCLTGQFCVRGKCQDEPPPGLNEPVVDSGPVVDDTPKPEPKPEPKPVDTAPATCTSNDQCSDPNKPHCYKSACVYGYIEFDFKAGYAVIDVSKAGQQCTQSSDCTPFGLVCSSQSRSCLLGTGTNISASGKIGDDAISLTDYAYGAIGAIDGDTKLRIIATTEFSDKLDQRLYVDIPLGQIKAGSISVDGTDIKAQFVYYRKEFTPPKTEVIGVAASGTITFTQADPKVASIHKGTASFILTKP